MKHFYTLILFFAVFLCSSSVHSQCYPDRHNTTLNNQWMSCTPSPNPNQARGASHWLQLSLDAYTALGRVNLWNLNHPDHLTSGIGDFAIDISLDGVTWTEVYSGNLAQATASSTYEGIEVVDLNHAVAKFIVITALSNYGGSCYGLSEIKIEQVDFPCDMEVLVLNQNPILPDVYNASQYIISTGVVNGETLLFGEDYVELNSGFTTESGSDLYIKNDPCVNN